MIKNYNDYKSYFQPSMTKIKQKSSFFPEYPGLTRPKVRWFCFLSKKDEEGEGRYSLYAGKDEN